MKICNGNDDDDNNNNIRNTVVGIVTVLQNGRSGDRILVGEKYFPSPKCLDPPRGPHNSPLHEYQAFFPVVQGAGPEITTVLHLVSNE